MNLFNRRFALIASAYAMVLGTAAAPALAADPIPLRISCAAAESDWLVGGLKVFKEQLEKSSPGQFNVSIHAASSLFRQGTEVPAMQRGNLDMSTMTTFEVEAQIPEYSVFSVGYLLRDYDHMAKVFNGPIGAEYTKAVADKMQLQILQLMYLGTRQVNMRVAKPVATPADLTGVKLRMPGGPGWLVIGKGLGASPTPMAMPEVYLALKTGAIDGQDNPLPIMRANNLQEVTQSIVMTSHLVQPVFLTLAKPVWDKLTDAQKAAVSAAAKAGAEFNDKSRLDDESKSLAFFKEKGLKVYTPDLAPFRASVAKAYTETDLPKAWQPGLKERIEATK
ncbi:TRAP transporter substrate-binding protein DctP [soil metagenome]